MIMLGKIALTASDVSGQRTVALDDVSADATVGEVLDELLPLMHLDRAGRNGERLQVQARLEREARHLHRSERVRDALQPNDHLVLHPQIMAGAGR